MDLIGGVLLKGLGAYEESIAILGLLRTHCPGLKADYELYDERGIGCVRT